MPKSTHIFLSDPAIVRRLAEQAAREHRTKKAVVVRALERYLAAEEQKDRRDEAACERTQANSQSQIRRQAVQS